MACSSSSGDNADSGPGVDSADGLDASMPAAQGPEASDARDTSSPSSPTEGAPSGDADAGANPGATDASPAADGGAPTGDGPESDGGATADGTVGGANAAIHDDFESDSLGKWTVTDPFGNPQQAGPSAPVTVDTTHAHSGMYAVKVHNGGLIGTAPPAPSFYGRFWVWLGSNPSPGRPGGGHWAWAVGAGTLPDGATPEVRQGGQFDILIDNYSLNDDVVLSDPNVFNDTDGGVTPTVGQWICVEFFYGKDSLRTWLGGTEVTALDVTPATVWAHGMRAPWSPAYSAIRIGYAGYNGNQVDLWVDDVAIDPNRIGCN